MKIKVNCHHCSTELLRYPSQIINNKAFCNKTCLAASKKHGSELFCVQCNTKFYRRFSEQDIAIRNNQFCSNECYQYYRSLNTKNDTYRKTGSKHTHIVVAESILKRPLSNGEVVHHIDNNKHNNDISNLAVLPSQAVHAKVHFGKEPINIDQYKLSNLLR